MSIEFENIRAIQTHAVGIPCNKQKMKGRSLEEYWDAPHKTGVVQCYVGQLEIICRQTQEEYKFED